MLCSICSSRSAAAGSTELSQRGRRRIPQRVIRTVATPSSPNAFCGNLQGIRGLIKNWLLADVGKRVIRVELSVCLVLLEPMLCSSGSVLESYAYLTKLARLLACSVAVLSAGILAEPGGCELI